MSDTPKIGLLVSVPWPVRLLGDFQDVTGMPAFSAALDLRTAVGANPRRDGLWRVTGGGLAGPIEFDPAGDAGAAEALPSLARARRALLARGVALRGGFDFQVLTRAPWSVADSPALDVACAAVLLELHGLFQNLSAGELAEWVMSGREEMEVHARQYPEVCAAAMGGALFAESGDARAARPCEQSLPEMALGWRPGAPPADALPDAVRAMLQSLVAMRRKWDAFDIRATELERATPMLNLLGDEDAGRVYSQLVARDLCRQARDMMESETGVDDDRIAELLDGAHELLRDYHGLSSPELERLTSAATGGGAIGCRLLPGLNAVLALTPGRQEDVVAALRAAGGEARGTALSDGIRIEPVAGRRAAPDDKASRSS